MTTCPRCGRVADDEFVCADCGAFLAGGRDDAPPAEVSVRRVALLALIVCLLGVVGAVALLRHTGRHDADLAAPLTSSPVELSNASLGQPSVPGQNPSAASARTSNTASLPATSSTATSSPARASRSARRSGSASASSSPRPTPHPSPSSTRPSSPHPSTTRPPSSAPPPAPSVHLAQSGSAGCGPHCYALVVTLSNFPAGQHNVSCFAGHAGRFGGYSTSSVTSSNCVYDHPHDSVWVVVDGHQSNTVSW